MFLSSASLIAILLGGSALARTVPRPRPPLGAPAVPETLRAKGDGFSAVEVLHELQALASHMQGLELLAESRNSHCNLFSVQERRDWAHLTTAQKKNYISALQCLLNKPSQSDPSQYPGARNRYDDFVVVHINQTSYIHGTGNFLTWHRYFTWAYEQALRDECGYEGYAPYWNWFAHADNLLASPVFDGSDTSLSGDGSYFPHNGSNPTIETHLPSGNGGGCVMSGPLVGMTVNLGPWYPSMDGLEADPNGAFGYNPHCLRRDLLNSAASEYFTVANLLNLTIGVASQNISTFQSELWGRFTDGFLGMHTVGHLAVGGDASSVFSSIADPTFFLHHAMVDHVYWIWQRLHPSEASTIAATITALNEPPSRDARLNDTVDLSEILKTPPEEIQRLLSTTAGPFCYTYA